MKLICFVLVSLLVACAQPKYVTINTQHEQSNDSFKLEADCSLHFELFSQCFSWRLIEPLEAQKNLTIIVKFYRPNLYDQTLVYEDIASNRVFKAKLWMTSMGHGSVPVQIKRLDVGTYEISNVNFIMSGTWQIYFDQIENDQVDRITVNIDVP